MLTAYTKTGKRISMAFPYKRETLFALRKQEEFWCPVCGEEVILKLGMERVFHFAHRNGGICRDHYEPETDYHLKGKLELYQWISRQKIPAVLEYYDADIQQRPDIMFIYNGKKYALEYQCSPITAEIFFTRTESYLKNGYIPLWIAGKKLIKSKRDQILSLSCFSYFFLRKTNDHQFYIPSYCPEQSLLHFSGPILTLSKNLALSPTVKINPNHINIDGLLMPKIPKHINVIKWFKEAEKSTLNWSFHPNPQQKRFLHEIYRSHLNLFLLPPEIGLPVPHSALIETSAIIWQTFLFLDILMDKLKGDLISLKELEGSFFNRVRKKDISLRQLPQFEQINPCIAVKEYILQLERIGAVTREGETAFRLQSDVRTPKSNRESEELRNLFYQKKMPFLTKL